MPSPSELLLVGSPGDERVTALQRARAKRGEPPAALVPWREVVEHPGRLRSALRPGVAVRIDSPGKSFEVERALVAAGAEVPDGGDAPRIGAAAAAALAFDRGRLLFPRQWYLGLRAVLARLDEELGEAPRFAHPPDVVTMFDKRVCHGVLAARGAPVPAALGPVGSWDALRAAMRARGIPRVFVKLAHGSSASGVVALRESPRGPRGFTTVEREGDRLYNTRRIRLVTRERELAGIVDALAREGVQVEEWLPKATLENRPLDLRVLVIAGRPRHTVVRTGRTAITNLQAGGRRGSLDALAAKLGAAAVERARAVAAAAAAAFPRTLAVGADVLIDPVGRPAILELNAFGDLLRGDLDAGEDPQEAQLAAVFGPPASAARAARAGEVPCAT